MEVERPRFARGAGCRMPQARITTTEPALAVGLMAMVMAFAPNMAGRIGAADIDVKMLQCINSPSD